MKKIIYLLMFLMIFCSCSISEKNEILFENTLEDVQYMANEKKVFFCLVLVDNHFVSKKYIEGLNLVNGMSDIAIFNIIDISILKNKWYEQWLCPMNYPLTCIFSSDGNLIDLVAGYTFESFQFIKESITNEDNKIESVYINRFGLDKKKLISVMDDILICKKKVEANENVCGLVENTINKIDYPFNLWLKIQNEKLYYKDRVKKTCSDLLLCKNSYYYLIYKDFFYYAENYLNTDYKINTAPFLEIETDTVKIHNAFYGSTFKFDYSLKNTGKYPMNILDIITGCSCLKNVGNKNHIVLSNKCIKIPFELNLDVKGLIERDFVIISDAINIPVLKIVVVADVIY